MIPLYCILPYRLYLVRSRSSLARVLEDTVCVLSHLRYITGNASITRPLDSAALGETDCCPPIGNAKLRSTRTSKENQNTIGGVNIYPLPFKITPSRFRVVFCRHRGPDSSDPLFPQSPANCNIGTSVQTQIPEGIMYQCHTQKFQKKKGWGRMGGDGSENPHSSRRSSLARIEQRLHRHHRARGSVILRRVIRVQAATTASKGTGKKGRTARNIVWRYCSRIRAVHPPTPASLHLV